MNLSVLERWDNFKRLLLLIFSLLMWVVSIVFSYMGFQSGVRSEWYFGIFALVLSGTITTMELYLNSQTFEFDNLKVGIIILWIGGIAAYAYGIWTNIIGVSIMMIGTGDVSSVAWNSQVVPIIVGILLEVLPEPMFVAFLTSKKIEKNYSKNKYSPPQNQQPKYNLPPRDFRVPDNLKERYHSDTHRN